MLGNTHSASSALLDACTSASSSLYSLSQAPLTAIWNKGLETRTTPSASSSCAPCAPSTLDTLVEPTAFRLASAPVDVAKSRFTSWFTRSNRNKQEDSEPVSGPAKAKRNRARTVSKKTTIKTGPKPKYCVGIDLGTTNSAITVLTDGKPQVIKPYGSSTDTLPSVVYFPKDGEPVVGVRARAQGPYHPHETVYSAKRYIGRKFDELDPKALKDVPYKVLASPNGDAVFEINGKQVRPEEVSAEVLKSMKASAEAYLREPIRNAVITIPAYFNDSQRKATMRAAELAGLKVDRLLAEPTAAALQCAMESGKDLRGKTIAVYDLGGGTFDISILRFGTWDDSEGNEGGGVIQVLATDGNSFLGGDDLDAAIVDWVVEKVKETEGVDVRPDASAMQELRKAVQRAKTENFDTPIPVTGPNNFRTNYTLSKEDQTTIVKSFMDRTEPACRRVLSDAGKKSLSVDEVIVVGGMAHLEATRQKVSEIFGLPVYASANPDLAVGYGAAVQSGQIYGKISKGFVMCDVTPLTMGVELVGNIMAPIIKRNSPVPIIKSQNFTTSSDDQTYAEIRVLQGERPLANENKFIGSFVLTDLNKGGKSKGGRRPDIRVTFKLNEDGILEVSAVDAVSGSSENTVILPSDGLTKAEIEERLADARDKASADQSQIESAVIKNEAEALLQEMLAISSRASRANRKESQKLGDDLREKLDSNASVAELKRSKAKLKNLKAKILAELSSTSQ